MSETGYYEQVEGGIYGQPDGPPLADIVANQEAVAALNAELAHAPGSVPQSYLHPGGGCLPTIGWTVQNANGQPAFPPYDGTHIGSIPDWEGDPNPISAGAYDQTQTVAYGDFNPLNRAPLGDGLLQFDDQGGNPNSVPEDLGGDGEY